MLDQDDYTEDHLALTQPSLDLDPQEWLEYDILSACLD